MALDNARMYAELDRAYKELQLIDKGKDDLIRQTKDEVALLRREVERRYRFDEIIGNSERMLEVFKLCEKVIDSNITVLIEGESGTGKELIARSIHYSGSRGAKPFVSQNCGGIPDTLLASELFGHKRGTFTGAFSDRRGLFEVANGGTIFLDEVCQMSPAMQASLLRVLQDGEIKPLGVDCCKKV
ncbi:MAG: AAA domain-containing protein, partial [Nitrososphaeria archaeon]|nr:AAA domain-containing protein [Nitrososphaeria archaeon]